jgi:hypothetical protein
MSILAWWLIPVTVALLIAGLVRVWGRRPRFRRAFEEVETFHGFLDALERPRAESSPRGGRSTA